MSDCIFEAPGIIGRTVSDLFHHGGKAAKNLGQKANDKINNTDVGRKNLARQYKSDWINAIYKDWLQYSQIHQLDASYDNILDFAKTIYNMPLPSKEQIDTTATVPNAAPAAQAPATAAPATAAPATAAPTPAAPTQPQTVAQAAAQPAAATPTARASNVSARSQAPWKAAANAAVNKVAAAPAPVSKKTTVNPRAKVSPKAPYIPRAQRVKAESYENMTFTQIIENYSLTEDDIDHTATLNKKQLLTIFDMMASRFLKEPNIFRAMQNGQKAEDILHKLTPMLHGTQEAQPNKVGRPPNQPQAQPVAQQASSPPPTEINVAAINDVLERYGLKPNDLQGLLADARKYQNANDMLNNLSNVLNTDMGKKLAAALLYTFTHQGKV